MKDVVFFISPCGRSLTDDSLRKLTSQVVKECKRDSMHYKCGPSVNTPSSLLQTMKEEELFLEDWEVVLVRGNPLRARLANREEKEAFILRLETADDSSLTGDILSSIIK